MIFKYFVASYQGGWEAVKPGFDYRWIIISLVCRLWRDVAHSTPALFGYLDFNRLAPEAVIFWLEQSRMADLCVWVSPRSKSPALQLALPRWSTLSSRIKRIYLTSDLGAQPWTRSDVMTNVSEIFIRYPGYHCLCLSPAITTFIGLRRFVFRGTIMSPIWGNGVFPPTLVDLELFLEPLADDSSDEEVVSTTNIVHGLRNLTLLENLLLSIEVVDDDGAPPASLPFPRLRSLSLHLTDRAFPTVFQLFVPSQVGCSRVAFRPYRNQDALWFCDRMVAQFVSFLKDQPDHFDTVSFDLSQDETVLTLKDRLGRIVSIAISTDHDRHFRSIFGAVDATQIVEVSVTQQGPVVRNPRSGKAYVSSAVLEGLTLFGNVAWLNLQGDAGFLMAELLTRLASGGCGREGMDPASVEVMWPCLRGMSLKSMERIRIPVLEGDVEEFVASSLFARKSLGLKIRTVKIHHCDFQRGPVGRWATVASTVIICGTYCSRLTFICVPV